MIVKTAAGKGEAEITEKKSRFIGLCAPVGSEAEAKALIAAARKRHYAARHHCFAFRVNGIERSSDDGEPSGTAGAPILSVLRGEGLSETACVVTRYFGGVLLGTGGLVRAYGAAAKAAAANAGVLTRREAAKIAVTVDYPLEARLRAACAAYSRETEYSGKVTYTVLVPVEEADGFEAAVKDAAYGEAEMRRAGAGWIET
jgi:uncharacterized YigZ family protein